MITTIKIGNRIFHIEQRRDWQSRVWYYHVTRFQVAYGAQNETARMNYDKLSQARDWVLEQVK